MLVTLGRDVLPALLEEEGDKDELDGGDLGGEGPNADYFGAGEPVTWSLKPRARITLRTVANSGLPLGESDL